MGFWESYTDRNSKNPCDGFDMQWVFGHIPRGRVLEVGCNRGLKLDILKNMGHTDLTGLEQCERARRLCKHDVIGGDIYDLPFKDKYFDVVFTSGVLIHLEEPGIAIGELLRVGKQVFGWEYYNATREARPYRPGAGLWRDDWVAYFKALGAVFVLNEIISNGDDRRQAYLCGK